ncbi:hypothetical protein DSO57_1025892 [Entomophthora muscae]|uniref:Uncharacterized protein n=1 Tax=Entomophthora muscae TaxID=34485 RepID=A0ACC2UBN2_9FUNG|nr:hypothetical protein DSO57_1025892 [Entomophthora muscae]
MLAIMQLRVGSLIAVLDPKQQVIDIQETAYTSAYKTKTLELTPCNALCTPISEFNIGDQAPYYQH